jgi:hypothetical protein
MVDPVRNRSQSIFSVDFNRNLKTLDLLGGNFLGEPEEHKRPILHGLNIDSQKNNYDSANKEPRNLNFISN